MFTGLVEEVGRVMAVTRRSGSLALSIAANAVLEDLAVGDSISVDGACQTVTSLGPASLVVESLAETLRKTTLGSFVPGRAVNLERALALGRRLGGHIVQGHVSGTAPVTEVRARERNVYLRVCLDPALARACVEEGSIAVDGVSLTIAEIRGDQVAMNIIPHTWASTTLRERRPGDRVNVETDLIGRYVTRLLGGAAEDRMRERLEDL